MNKFTIVVSILLTVSIQSFYYYNINFKLIDDDI